MNKRSGKESKKRIIAEAVKTFSKYGYKGTSMRMIARRANISVGGLYLYFKNKDDLYLSLIKTRIEDLMVKTTEALRDVKDPSDALRVYLTLRLNYARKHRELILALRRDHGLGLGTDMKRKFFRQQRKVIEGILKKGVASRTFRRCDAEETAKVIFSLVRGFISSLVVERDALFSPDECCDLILRGLLRKG